MRQKGRRWLGFALVLLFIWLTFELLFRFGVLHSSGEIEIVPPSFSASDKYEP
jgi:hypothetical protein